MDDTNISAKYAQAVALSEQGDYKAALDLFLELGAQGHTFSQAYAGIIYVSSLHRFDPDGESYVMSEAEKRAAQEDVKEALQWFTKAAMAGDPESISYVHHLTAQLGVGPPFWNDYPPDEKAAYEMAARIGYGAWRFFPPDLHHTRIYKFCENVVQQIKDNP